MVSTPDSVGPMHGVQPSPKIAPMIGALISPPRGSL
jgi:hypothetical protein